MKLPHRSFLAVFINGEFKGKFTDFADCTAFLDEEFGNLKPSPIILNERMQINTPADSDGNSQEFELIVYLNN